MPGSVSAGLKQGQAGQNLGIAINQPITERGMIPVGSCCSKAWMSAACQFVVCALNDKFGFRERIVISCMVDIEMGADEQIDIVGLQTKIGEMLDHIFLVLDWRCSCWWLYIGREAAINQDMLAITGLDEIAARHHL